MNEITKLIFYNEATILEELKPGKRLPTELKFPGSTANVMTPEFGFMGLMRFEQIQNVEVRAVRYDRLNIGLMQGGPHGTIVHCRYSLHPTNAPELKTDFAFSAALQLKGGQPDPRLIIRENMLFTTVLVAEETGVVAAVRQTRISTKFASEWNDDITRQLQHLGNFNEPAHLWEVAKVYSANATIDRRACFHWSVSLNGKAA